MEESHLNEHSNEHSNEMNEEQEDVVPFKRKYVEDELSLSHPSKRRYDSTAFTKHLSDNVEQNKLDNVCIEETNNACSVSTHSIQGIEQISEDSSLQKHSNVLNENVTKVTSTVSFSDKTETNSSKMEEEPINSKVSFSNPNLSSTVISDEYKELLCWFRMNERLIPNEKIIKDNATSLLYEKRPEKFHAFVNGIKTLVELFDTNSEDFEDLKKVRIAVTKIRNQLYRGVRLAKYIIHPKVYYFLLHDENSL